VALIPRQTNSVNKITFHSRSTLIISSLHNFRPPDRASCCAHLSNDLVALPNDSSHMTDTLSSPFQIARNDNEAVQSEERPAMQLYQLTTWNSTQRRLKNSAAELIGSNVTLVITLNKNVFRMTR
jgi:hypothetical protein